MRLTAVLRRLAPILMLAAGLLPELSAALTIPTGSGSLSYTWSGKVIPVWTYRPVGVAASAPVVFVCHGTNRNGAFYRDSWITQADVRGCIIVAPEFTDTAFPGSAGYNLGNMVVSDVDNTLRPQSEWGFNVIEALFDEVRAGLGATARTTYRMYGHSAGAQFVHRFLLFAPQARVERAVSANAGWWTVPELTTTFPYGLSGSNYSLAILRTRLAQQHIVLLGTADTDPNDPNLSHAAGAEAQGPYRLARGEYFYSRTTAAAPTLGATFNWKLEYAPGIAHDTSGMTPYASALLFDATPYFPPVSTVDEADSPIITRDHAGYSTSFNHAFTSSSTAVNVTWENDVTVPGWYLLQNATGVPTSITAQASLSNTNSGFLGFIASSDAPNNFLLGTRASDTTAGSVGTGAGIYFGLRLRNQTGFTINQFSLGYTAGQFYRSSGTSFSTIAVSYAVRTSTQTTTLNSGTFWSSLSSLAYTSPFVGDGTSAASTVNFNLSGNNTTFAPITVSAVSWPNGSDLWIRWYVPNVNGVDQGIGIDAMKFAVTGYAAAAPVIFSQPQSRTANYGANATFSVDTFGVPSPTFQWRKNTVALSGETGSSLTLPSVTAASAGNYTVTVSNATGTVTSQIATLTVKMPYTIWTETKGLSLALAGPTTDADGDGLPNVAEYVFGTNPAVADAAGTQALSNDGTGFVFRFQRDAASANDTAVEVQSSSDLINWITVRTLTSSDVGQLSVPIPSDGSGRIAARLKITWTGSGN